MNDNCIFCKIIGKEIPSTTLYEDEDFCVIMDISPASKGHAILLAKKHVPNIYELDENLASKALVVVSKVAKAMKEELRCDGLNILQNNGEAAGQTVFHFHIHLIPRYKDDQVNITWKQGKYGEGEAAALADGIRKRL
jgi:histidine triad (HIT) family protein